MSFADIANGDEFAPPPYSSQEFDNKVQLAVEASVVSSQQEATQPQHKRSDDDSEWEQWDDQVFQEAQRRVQQTQRNLHRSSQSDFIDNRFQASNQGPLPQVPAVNQPRQRPRPRPLPTPTYSAVPVASSSSSSPFTPTPAEQQYFPSLKADTPPPSNAGKERPNWYHEAALGEQQSETASSSASSSTLVSADPMPVTNVGHTAQALSQTTAGADLADPNPPPPFQPHAPSLDGPAYERVERVASSQIFAEPVPSMQVESPSPPPSVASSQPSALNASLADGGGSNRAPTMPLAPSAHATRPLSSPPPLPPIKNNGTLGPTVSRSTKSISMSHIQSVPHIELRQTTPFPTQFYTPIQSDQVPNASAFYNSSVSSVISPAQHLRNPPGSAINTAFHGVDGGYPSGVPQHQQQYNMQGGYGAQYGSQHGHNHLRAGTPILPPGARPAELGQSYGHYGVYPRY